MSPLKFGRFRDERSPSRPTTDEAAAVPGELSRRSSGAFGNLGGGGLSPSPAPGEHRHGPWLEGCSRSSSSRSTEPLPFLEGTS